MIFIDIHTHNIKPQENVIKIVNHFSDAYLVSDKQNLASVGLHPWYIKKDFNKQLTLIDKYAADNNIIAIGEAGLDKAIDIDLELQTAVFIAQAAIADTHIKPMIIHSVKTYNDLIVIRKFYLNSPTWIIHGFSGNIIIAKDLIKHGFYLSFGKDLFNEVSLASKTFSAIPLQYVFLETDNSDLNIETIYAKAAELLNMSVEDLKMQISENFQNVFRIKNI